MLQMKKSKRFHGTTFYESNINVTVQEDPYGYSEFNLTMPKYIIVKESDNTYTSYKFNYVIDYMLTNNYIGNLETWKQCYTVIWDGSKSARGAKEICEEDYKED